MMVSTFGTECPILKCTVSFKLQGNKIKYMFHFTTLICLWPEEKEIADGCGNGLDSFFWSSWNNGPESNSFTHVDYSFYIYIQKKYKKKGNQIIVTVGEILWSLLKLPTFLH